MNNSNSHDLLKSNLYRFNSQGFGKRKLQNNLLESVLESIFCHTHKPRILSMYFINKYNQFNNGNRYHPEYFGDIIYFPEEVTVEPGLMSK